VIKDVREALAGFFAPIVPVFVEPVNQSVNKPYGVISLSFGGFGDQALANLIVYSANSDYTEAEKITDKIRDAVGNGGVVITDGTARIWLQKGDPFAQHYPQPDRNIRAIYINFDVRIYKV
jgi:hypothetical protein